MFAQTRILLERCVTSPPARPLGPKRAQSRNARVCRWRRTAEDALMERFDVVVVGGGPAGASAAYWLAEAGHDVVVVEKKRFPREKTCGDGLTPRAVKQLDDMGLASALAEHHRFDGLRSIAFGQTLELPWPDVPGLPRHGYVITRHDLDDLVADRAAKAGATLRQGCEAVAPVVEGGFVTGLTVVEKDNGRHPAEITARYVV